MRSACMTLQRPSWKWLLGKGTIPDQWSALLCTCMNARSTLICDCYYIPLLVLTHLWPCCARGPRSLLIKLPPKTTAPLRRTNLYIKNNAFNNEMTKIKYFPIVTVTVIHPTMGTSAKAVELWGGYIYNTEVQYKSYRKQYWNKNHMRWHNMAKL